MNFLFHAIEGVNWGTQAPIGSIGAPLRGWQNRIAAHDSGELIGEALSRVQAHNASHLRGMHHQPSCLACGGWRNEGVECLIHLCCTTIMICKSMNGAKYE